MSFEQNGPIDEQELTPEQRAEADALVAALFQEAERVGVDWEAARPELLASSRTIERELGPDEIEVGVELNVSAMLAALRSLPNGSGTDAFLEALRHRSS